MNEESILFLKSISKVTIKEDLANNLFISKIQPGSNLAHIIDINKMQLLLFKHLKEQACLEYLNNEICNSYELKLFYLQFKYQEYLNALKNIVSLFEINNVNYSIIKGFSFIDELYTINNIIYRDFSDVDILISPNDISKVDRSLAELGMVQGVISGNSIKKAERKDIINWRLNSHQLHEYIMLSTYSHISPFFSICVDINTTIFEGGVMLPPINTDDILENTIVKESNGFRFKCLNYTYSLLQMCYHFYKDTVYEVKRKSHDNYCLLKFCDIREYIIKHYEKINWNLFVDIVNSNGIASQIYHTLRLVSSFYGDLILENLSHRIKPTKNYIDDEIDWNKLLF